MWYSYKVSGSAKFMEGSNDLVLIKEAHDCAPCRDTLEKILIREEEEEAELTFLKLTIFDKIKVSIIYFLI